MYVKYCEQNQVSPASQFLWSSGRDKRYPKNYTTECTITNGGEYSERT